MNEKFKKENKPLTDSKKSELKTLKMDIKKLELSIKDMEKLEGLVNKNGDFEQNAVKSVQSKMEEQNKIVKEVGKSLNNAVDNSKAALQEIKVQKDKIYAIIAKTDEAEKALTVHEQILGCMENEHLFRKLKLVGISILLFIAIILVLYIKFLS